MRKHMGNVSIHITEHKSADQKYINIQERQNAKIFK